MRKWLLFVGVLLLVLLAQFLIYYRGGYTPPSFKRLEFEKIGVVKAPVAEFRDEFTPSAGTVLIDMAHANEIEAKELGVLVSRLTARGFRTEFLESRGELEEKLKYADAYVVISPGSSYSSDHANLVARYVEKSGKLLLIHDPTRRDEINALSAGFGVVYDSGYLYNQVENDGNYQYIFLTDFADNSISKGLSRVAMYVASSIASTAQALAYTDSNTFSNTQPKQNFTPMVLAMDGKVLALGDLTFMLEPYNSVFDNNKLLSNIADFLTSGGRVYYAADYPYYLGDGFSLVYTEETLLEDALKIKNSIGRRPTLRIDDPGSGHALVLGLYNSTTVKKYMEDAGIVVSDKLEIKGLGKVQKNSSFIISVTQQDGRRVLLVASDEKSGIVSAISHLRTIKDISLTDFIAYSTYAPKKNEKTAPVQEETEEQIPFTGEQRNSSFYSAGKQALVVQ